MDTAQSHFFCKNLIIKKIIIKKSISAIFAFSFISFLLHVSDRKLFQIFSDKKNPSDDMNDTFEKIYRDADEDKNYYQDAAIVYLTDIEDLKDKLTDCYERVKNNRTMLALQKEQQEFYERKIANLKSELERRRPGKTKTFRPVELENRVQAFTNQMRAEIHKFNTMGRFENIDNSINEVRDLFNIFLAELNNLNTDNRDVIGTLETLIRLDVSI